MLQHLKRIFLIENSCLDCWKIARVKDYKTKIIEKYTNRLKRKDGDYFSSCLRLSLQAYRGGGRRRKWPLDGAVDF